MVRFVQHRIGDPRIVRLIQKWLKAGILEDGETVVVSEKGTGQGSVMAPCTQKITLRWRSGHGTIGGAGHLSTRRGGWEGD